MTGLSTHFPRGEFKIRSHHQNKLQRLRRGGRGGGGEEGEGGTSGNNSICIAQYPFFRKRIEEIEDDKNRSRISSHLISYHIYHISHLIFHLINRASASSTVVAPKAKACLACSSENLFIY